MGPSSCTDSGALSASRGIRPALAFSQHTRQPEHLGQGEQQAAAYPTRVVQSTWEPRGLEKSVWIPHSNRLAMWVTHTFPCLNVEFAHIRFWVQCGFSHTDCVGFSHGQSQPAGILYGRSTDRRPRVTPPTPPRPAHGGSLWHCLFRPRVYFVQITLKENFIIKMPI